MTAPPHHAYTNALARSTSPYLLQHAHNPVDWKPWGPAAFDEAAKRDVPIFLSVGYSTCYWCHVMERQVFEVPELALPLSERFVCIKVDREERPDVDDLYMAATQLLTGGGGWPMNLFLTPPAKKPTVSDRGPIPRAPVPGAGAGGLLPFWAGTYIPPTPMHGRPSFAQVVAALDRAWREERDEVIEQADRVADAVRQHLQQNKNQPRPITYASIQQISSQLMRRYDATHGGFGGPSGPKFPSPSVPAFLLRVSETDHPDAARIGEALRHTLDRMARGGMFDQVGGGFHRYSVDEQWLVPHFEKMLYDNGQLLELYALAFDRWRDLPASALYARILRETADYLLREMRDDTGAFWSAQDAEVNTREGHNYVWTPDQVRNVLAGEADADTLTGLALEMYGLRDGPNFRDPHHPPEVAPPVNVLHLTVPLEELASETGIAVDALHAMRRRINALLLRVRNARPQPGTDDKVLTGWNGLAIAGLARAGAALHEPRYLDAARGAADAVWEHLRGKDGRLLRTMRHGQTPSPPIHAFLEDYAFYIHGLLALARLHPDGATFIKRAIELTQDAIQLFGDDEAGGYFDTLAGQSDLFVRSRSTYDGAMPCASGQMIHNLIDLYEQLGDEAYLQRALRDLRAVSGALRDTGPGMTHTAAAALRLLAVSGDAGAALSVEAATESSGAQADPVRITAERIDASPHRYRVTLHIADGYHLNANPSSDATLIATEVFSDQSDVTVHYPPASLLNLESDSDALRVYEGEVSLGVESPGPVRSLTIRYQPCTGRECMAAREVTVEVA